MIRNWRLLLPTGFAISALALTPYILLKREQYSEPEALADDGGQFVNINGIKTYYVEYGSPRHATLLFLHGFGGSTFSWRYLMGPLAQAGYRIIAFDTPPFGLSAKPRQFRYDLTAQTAFAIQFMDALGIAQATLVGHSLGANIAMRMAIHHPDRVQRLILIDAAINHLGKTPRWLAHLLDLPPIRFAARFALRLLLRPQPMARFIASTHQNRKPLATAEVRAYLRPKQIRGWDMGLLDLIPHAITGRIPDEHIQSVQAPCLLVWGDNDPVIPIEWGLRLRQLLPHAQWKEYPHTGHSPMEENPQHLTQDILSFLKTPS